MVEEFLNLAARIALPQTSGEKPPTLPAASVLLDKNADPKPDCIFASILAHASTEYFLSR